MQEAGKQRHRYEYEDESNAPHQAKTALPWQESIRMLCLLTRPSIAATGEQ